MLIANTVLLGSLIGCALSQNWAQHFGLRILLGFATGATESVRPLYFFFVVDLTYHSFSL